jgi:hypothetical protein
MKKQIVTSEVVANRVLGYIERIHLERIPNYKLDTIFILKEIIKGYIGEKEHERQTTTKF